MTSAEVLVVELAGERRALPDTVVREILPLGHLTPVPTAPPSVCGVIQVRGQVIPVLDLGGTLKGPTAPPSSGGAPAPDRPPRVARVGAPLVIVDAGADGTAALLVDRVGEVEPAATSAARAIDLAVELAPLRRAVAR